MQTKENPIKVIARRIVILRKFIFAGIKVNVLKPYWHDHYIIKALLLSVLINLATWIYLSIHKFDENFPIILHYNLFFGVDSVGDYRQVFILPAVGLIVIAVNSALGQFFYKLEKLASYLLTLTIVIVQVILLLASYLTIRVNS